MFKSVVSVTWLLHSHTAIAAMDTEQATRAETSASEGVLREGRGVTRWIVRRDGNTAIFRCVTVRHKRCF